LIFANLIQYKKAGLAPAFLFARFIAAAFVRERRNPLSNNPLMAGEEHWKSALVPPMFQTHPLASIPGLPEDARR
jgi:hypothetical protein